MRTIARLLVPLALLAFGAVYFREAGTIRALYDTGPVGPDGFPKLLVVALVVAVAFVIVGEVRADKPGEGAVRPVDIAIVALVVLILALYIVLFQRIGFLPSTLALSLALLCAFARARIRARAAIIASLAITLAVYALFALVFEVRLPAVPWLAATGSQTALA